jgi:hypothetical protein
MTVVLAFRSSLRFAFTLIPFQRSGRGNEAELAQPGRPPRYVGGYGRKLSTQE